MILIITNSDDATIDLVYPLLLERRVPVFRLNTDEFPSVLSGAVKFGSEADGWGDLVSLNTDSVLSFKDVRSVWYRRPIPPVPSPTITHEGARRFAIDESYEFLRGLWHCLRCYWMSPPEAIRIAEHKIVQLQLAMELGFFVPRTVITNRPQEVRELAANCPDGIVAKPLYLGFVSDIHRPTLIYTTILQPTELDDEAIRLAPAIYQQFVRKPFDVRVTVVVKKVFATKIVATNLPDEIPDWRYAGGGVDHEPYDLPECEAIRCRSLLSKLGLEFGAIDYAATSDGRHVFLEINPNGQWGWIEYALGTPIAGAIADRLAWW